MDAHKLRQLLLEVQAGQLDVEAAMHQLRSLPYAQIGDARLDLHRPLRQGLPEVVFCQNKTLEQVLAILERLIQHHDRVLATRVAPDMAAGLQARLTPPAGLIVEKYLDYDPVSRLLILQRTPQPLPEPDAPYAMVVSGGPAWWAGWSPVP